MELLFANAVILAHHFNPSIFTQLWLRKHEVVRNDQDFQSGCIFSDGACQLNTTHFKMVVTPDFLQIMPSGTHNEQEVVSETLNRIAGLLPQTPYIGIGLNFTWHVRPQGETIDALSRGLFFHRDNVLCGFFDDPGARFGGYFSKDYRGVRLKLDVKPITVKQAITDTGPGEDRLQLYFNFHKDLSTPQAPQQIGETVALWTDARNLTREVMERTFGGE